MLLTNQIVETIKVHTPVMKIVCQKRPTYPQKRPINILSARNGGSGGAAVESNCRDYQGTYTCDEFSTSKEAYISANETYISAKET